MTHHLTPEKTLELSTYMRGVEEHEKTEPEKALRFILKANEVVRSRNLRKRKYLLLKRIAEQRGVEKVLEEEFR